MTYTYEADSNSINMSPKEMTGFIKSPGGLKRIAIVFILDEGGVTAPQSTFQPTKEVQK